MTFPFLYEYKTKSVKVWVMMHVTMVVILVFSGSERVAGYPSTVQGHKDARSSRLPHLPSITLYSVCPFIS